MHQRKGREEAPCRPLPLPIGFAHVLLLLLLHLLRELKAVVVRRHVCYLALDRIASCAGHLLGGHHAQIDILLVSGSNLLLLLLEHLDLLRNGELFHSDSSASGSS